MLCDIRNIQDAVAKLQAARREVSEDTGLFKSSYENKLKEKQMHMIIHQPKIL